VIKQEQVPKPSSLDCLSKQIGMVSKESGVVVKKEVVIKEEEVAQRALDWQRIRGGLRKGWSEVRPSAAFKYAQMEVLPDKLQFLRLQVHLDCMFCSQTGINSIPFLYYYEEKYYNMMMTTNRWFETSLITAFIALKIHDNHVKNLMFDTCPYPTSDPTTRQLPSQVKRLIVVGWEGHHYGFLEINIPNRYVLVKDGFLSYSSMRKWTNHIVFILKKWRLIANDRNDVIYATTIVTHFSRSEPTTPDGVLKSFRCEQLYNAILPSVAPSQRIMLGKS
jgi:hypothetical protein